MTTPVLYHGLYEIGDETHTQCEYCETPMTFGYERNGGYRLDCPECGNWELVIPQDIE